MSYKHYSMFQKKSNSLEYTEEFKDALLWDDPDIVRSFLTRQSHPVYDKAKRSPLHMAARFSSVKCIPFVLHYGYDMHEKDKDLETPLMNVLQSESKEALEAMLSCSKNSLMEDLSWLTNDELKLLSDTYTDRHLVGVIIRAMMKENVSIQEIYKKLNLHNCITYHGAICSGSQDLVRLVDYEISHNNSTQNINKYKTDGMLAAIADKNVNMIQLMFRLGVKIDTKTEDGHNLLTFAASQLNPDDVYVEVLRVLLQLGANVHESCNGFNATQWVAKCGNLDSLRLVFAYGGNINDKDEQGNTLLHLAVQNPNMNVLRFLVKMGLENVKASDLAKKLKNREALQILDYNFSLKD